MISLIVFMPFILIIGGGWLYMKGIEDGNNRRS